MCAVCICLYKGGCIVCACACRDQRLWFMKGQGFSWNWGLLGIYLPLWLLILIFETISYWTGGSCFITAGWQMSFRVLPVSQHRQCWDYVHTLLQLAFTCAWDTNSGPHSCLAGTLHLPRTYGIFSLGFCLGEGLVFLSCIRFGCQGYANIKMGRE